MLSILLGIGELLLQCGQTARGLELLSVAAHHPAGEYGTKQHVQRLIARYGDRFSSELSDPARQYDASTDLSTLVADVQADLVTPLAAGEQHDDTERSPFSPALVEPLTERELEVLHLIAEGLTNREIAQRLSVVVGTVKAHNNNIYGKLGAGNRVQALARARALNLL
jgi:LuxR family maltose regulon positive regulatory protein